MSILEKHFAKIGARLKTSASQRGRGPDFAIDVKKDRQGEYFEFAMRRPVDLRVLQAEKDARHILLLSETGERFLCGHDERHWFVAGIADRVSTVAAAKLSLMPKAVREQVSQMSPAEYDNRSNRAFKRQGEWFFVPVRKAINVDFILKDEPLQKTPRNKPHWCSELYREGGERVYVIRGKTYNDAEYAAAITADPKIQASVQRSMVRNPTVYVRGTVRHADHSTVHLADWHRVFMNAEFATGNIAFLD